jgi:hypothetical protein
VTRERAEATIAIDEVLQGIQRMIHKLSFVGSRNHHCQNMRQDLTQLANLHLAGHCLPRYDRLRGIKVTTFLHKCLGRFFAGKRRSEGRHFASKRYQRAPKTMRLTDPLRQTLQVKSNDTPESRFVEAVADYVIQHPEDFLTRAQAAILGQLLANDGMQMQELSKRLGYNKPTSFSTILRRIKDRVSDIDIEGLGIELLAKGQSGETQ